MPSLPGMEEFAQGFFGAVDAPEITDFPTTFDEEQDADPVLTPAERQRLVNILGFDPAIEWADDDQSGKGLDKKGDDSVADKGIDRA